jgi:hypothetical protein
MPVENSEEHKLYRLERRWDFLHGVCVELPDILIMNAGQDSNIVI